MDQLDAAALFQLTGLAVLSSILALAVSFLLRHRKSVISIPTPMPPILPVTQFTDIEETRKEKKGGHEPSHFPKYSKEIKSSFGGSSLTGVFGSNLPFFSCGSCCEDVVCEIEAEADGSAVAIVVAMVVRSEGRKRGIGQGRGVLYARMRERWGSCWWNWR